MSPIIARRLAQLVAELEAEIEATDKEFQYALLRLTSDVPGAKEQRRIAMQALLDFIDAGNGGLIA